VVFLFVVVTLEATVTMALVGVAVAATLDAVATTAATAVFTVVTVDFTAFPFVGRTAAERTNAV